MSLGNQAKALGAIAYGRITGLTETQVVHLLEQDNLLVPDPQIIRTPADLEALDPDTLLIPEGFNSPITRQSMDNFGITVSGAHYAVVVASGEYTRACREALEGGPL